MATKKHTTKRKRSMSEYGQRVTRLAKMYPKSKKMDLDKMAAKEKVVGAADPKTGRRPATAKRSSKLRKRRSDWSK